MFVLSQYLLNASGMCKTQQILSYSIALGLILYSSIYLYLLFYNEEYLSIFNKFIIYIVVVDLLLSAFYYFNIQEKNDAPKLQIKSKKEQKEESEDESDEEDEDDDEEVEYMSSDDEDEEQLDVDSQKYIDDLIAQARLSDQQRMSALMTDMEEDAPELLETEDQQELEPEPEPEQEPEAEQEPKEDEINQQIEDIIDEVATKKKPAKRAPKKKASAPPA
jgi:hypothetical protein